MKVSNLFISKRRAVFELRNSCCYAPETPIELHLNGALYGCSERNVFAIDKLQPDSEYSLVVKSVSGSSESASIQFRTEREYLRLNVKQFGAAGDGIKEDTLAIQAAIMACPEDSTIFIPPGVYPIVSLFLKSGITLDLAEGAVLKAIEDRNRYAILPGFIETTDEKEEHYFTTWEGNPLSSFTSIINGLNVKDVSIVGAGTIDGNASKKEWWLNAKKKRIAWRPKLIFLNNCSNITVEGIKIQNSPSWTIHPLFSKNIKFINLDIYNPPDSPNTDGIDPESCFDVSIIGSRISVGDDCIAIKSGKIYLGKRLKRPSKNIVIRNCYMERGHGAVVMGSEIAGGVHSVTVEQCLFYKTDKGIRLKTRRGRGEDSIVAAIRVNNISMNEVGIPIAMYAFYYCDPDGKSDYVSTQEPLPVDERTPKLKDMHFSNIHASHAHVAAGYINGLPELKIEEITIENMEVDFSPNAYSGFPAMMTHCEKTSRMGFLIKNVDKLTIKNLQVRDSAGEPLLLQDVDHPNIG